MDIAALSVSLNQSALSQAVSIKILDMANNQAEQQGQNVVKMMETSLDPNLGRSLDIRA
ncbi:YjfB family protein [Paenibacillus sp. NEAU-GSW1]|uniref:YjfB family protein n=1 Tax=Paenibacillus sp. NEAU-GSW1 TaxID=2682486 RepID=UPI00139DBFA3|nr:putative motility protein [Paenibacillus sp. NEAU-GSW1]